MIKKSGPTLVSIALFATCSMARQKHSDKEAKEGIPVRSAMAAAHEAAAKCLEAGKKEDVCTKELQTACKGLAIGKYCGMKHDH